MSMPSPQRARTLVLGAVASLAVAVTGTAIFSANHDDPEQIQRAEASTGGSEQSTAPSQAPLGGQRGQAVGATLRSKALRTAVLTDIPPSALAAYQRAASSMNVADPGCHVPWTLLAAVGQVESNHGRSTSRNARGIVGVPLDGRGVQLVADTDGGVLDGDKVHDRAVGPMQLLPGTWASVAVDADGDGKRDPQDIDDAALGAAVYLCGTGADLSSTDGQAEALKAYNNSGSYVALVMSVAKAYAADEKASYAVNRLQLGDVDLSDVGMDITKPPSSKKKATTTKKTAKTKTTTTPAAKTTTPTTSTPKPTKPTSPTPTSPPSGGGTTTPPTTTPPTPVAKVEVPNVIGKAFSEAQSLLTGTGLVGVQGDKTYAPAAIGSVVAASPGVGTSVDKGSTVTLTTSLGVPTDIVGQTAAAAEAELEKYGFSVTTEDDTDSDQPAGIVTSMTPGTDDTSVARVLHVSTGPTTSPSPTGTPSPTDSPTS